MLSQRAFFRALVRAFHVRVRFALRSSSHSCGELAFFQRKERKFSTSGPNGICSGTLAPRPLAKLCATCATKHRLRIAAAGIGHEYTTILRAYAALAWHMQALNRKGSCADDQAEAAARVEAEAFVEAEPGEDAVAALGVRCAASHCFRSSAACICARSRNAMPSGCPSFSKFVCATPSCQRRQLSRKHCPNDGTNLNDRANLDKSKEREQ